MDDGLGPPDIELTARVRGNELRFDAAPETAITFDGSPAHRSTSATERENLPDAVTPGTTYRRVEVVLRIEGRLAARLPPQRSGSNP